MRGDKLEEEKTLRVEPTKEMVKTKWRSIDERRRYITNFGTRTIYHVYKPKHRILTGIRFRRSRTTMIVLKVSHRIDSHHQCMHRFESLLIARRSFISTRALAWNSSTIGEKIEKLRWKRSFYFFFKDTNSTAGERHLLTNTICVLSSTSRWSRTNDRTDDEMMIELRVDRRCEDYEEMFLLFSSSSAKRHVVQMLVLEHLMRLNNHRRIYLSATKTDETWKHFYYVRVSQIRKAHRSGQREDHMSETIILYTRCSERKLCLQKKIRGKRQDVKRSGFNGKLQKDWRME